MFAFKKNKTSLVMALAIVSASWMTACGKHDAVDSGDQDQLAPAAVETKAVTAVQNNAVAGGVQQVQVLAPMLIQNWDNPDVKKAVGTLPAEVKAALNDAVAAGKSAPNSGTAQKDAVLKVLIEKLQTAASSGTFTDEWVKQQETAARVLSVLLYINLNLAGKTDALIDWQNQQEKIKNLLTIFNGADPSDDVVQATIDALKAKSNGNDPNAFGAAKVRKVSVVTLVTSSSDQALVDALIEALQAQAKANPKTDQQQLNQLIQDMQGAFKLDTQQAACEAANTSQQVGTGEDATAATGNAVAGLLYDFQTAFNNRLKDRKFDASILDKTGIDTFCKKFFSDPRVNAAGTGSAAKNVTGADGDLASWSVKKNSSQVQDPGSR